MPEDRLYFIIAGEASGDLLGAGLMKALKKKTGGKVRFAGIGGERMLAEGMESLFPQSELAHMGVFEILLHIPNILKRINQTADEAKRLNPAALITVDSPDFSFRVAKKLKGCGFPLIHYVAPTVWAWRPGRAKKIAKFLDHLMVLLPFEPPYFLKENLPCSFVGHPIVESGAGSGDADRFRQKFKIEQDAAVLCVLPGSRAGEVKRLMPVFEQTVNLLAAKHKNLRVVIPTVGNVADMVKNFAEKWSVSPLLIMSDEDKYDAFAASDAALACSGTVSVELAMANLPSVIAYKASALTAFLAPLVVKVKYATLINIMRDKMIMPEFILRACVPENLAGAVERLLSHPAARDEQKKELLAIAEWLGKGSFVPSEKAAETVLSVVAEKSGGARCL